MPAAPARLRVAGDVAGVTALQRSVAIERRQAVTPWLDQVQARQVGSGSTTPTARHDPGVGPGRSVRSATASRRIAVRDAYEIRLELASQDVADPERPEIGRVERRIQPVGAERRIRIDPPGRAGSPAPPAGSRCASAGGTPPGAHGPPRRRRTAGARGRRRQRRARPGGATRRARPGRTADAPVRYVAINVTLMTQPAGADSSTSALVGGGVNRLTTINVAIERASAG